MNKKPKVELLLGSVIVAILCSFFAVMFVNKR
jgi:hypothetical protein